MVDIRHIGKSLHDHIEARAAANMPPPVRLPVVDAANQSTGGWVWCTLNQSTVRCYTPGNIDASPTGTVLMAIPIGNGDYFAIGVAWNGSDNSPRIARTVTSTVSGGHEASKDLTLKSTTHATKGNVIIEDALKSSSGRILNTTRVTTTYQILITDHVVFANTDGAAWTITLPVGAEGQTLKIINSGSSVNNLTVAPSGAEDLLGVNSNFTLADAETLVLSYNATDGWY